MVDRYKVGQLVQLNDERKGTVQFVGETSFASGDWIGVAFEEASGKNDGSVQGQRYFDCEPGHGMFLRATGISRILQQSPPKPKTITGPRAPAPSTVAKTAAMSNGLRRPGSVDLAASKRQSINSASPTPQARAATTVNGNRSSLKPTARQPAPTPVTGSSSSRNATSISSRAASSRPSVTSSRSSLSSTATRNTSATSSTSRPSRPSISTALASSRGPKASNASALSRTNATSVAESPRPTTGNSVKPAHGEAEHAAGQDHDVDQGLHQDVPGEEPSQPREESPNRSIDVGIESHAEEKMNGNLKIMERKASPRPPARPLARTAASERQIEDLETKLRLQEKQRNEDREKLKTLERLQTEKDRFEGIIQKLQSKLQPQQQELAELRKQVKEKESRLEELEATQAEQDSSMEMVALDREMAEEQADALRTELDVFKQKVEELELEVEVLREENQEFGKEVSPEERSSHGWMQLERESQRYRDALVRLRDVTQDKESELQEEIASLQDDLKQMGGLKEQYEETKERLKQSEAAVEDLKQQLETATGAEEMLEELTEKNMTLTEHIDNLKLNIEDLENLKELNDELELNHVEAEKQMQDELDFKDTLLGEQRRHAEGQDQKLDDYEYTTSKFRDLVSNLQSHLEDMKASQQISEAEAEELSSRSKAMTDLNLKLQSSAATTQMNTIDLELRRLEAEEAIEHLAIVRMFLPESFKSERDSVLTYLRFRRIATKAKILQNILKDKIGATRSMTASDDAFSICDILDKLVWIAAMCHRFVGSISTCALDQFAKYQGALHELEPVERGMNGHIEALKKGDFKEQNVAEELRRSKALLTHLAEVHIAVDRLEDYAEDVVMRTSLMQSYLENTAIAMTLTRALMPQTKDHEGDGEGEEEYLSIAENFISQTRSAKVVAGKALQSLEELRARSMSLELNTSSTFEDGQDLSSELACLVRNLGNHIRGSQASQENDVSDDPEVNSKSLLVSALYSFTSANLPDTTASTPFPPLNQKLRQLTTLLSTICDLAGNINNTAEFEPATTPWRLRANAIQSSTVTHASTEVELQRLKHDVAERATQLRLRDQSLEEQAVKIELLESRTQDANAKANRILELQRSVEAGKSRERELADAIDKHMREAETAIAERDRWKRLADERRLSPPEGEEPAGPTMPRSKKGEKTVASAREMQALRVEIEGLQGAIRFLREDNRKARLAHPDHESMSWLRKPLMARPNNDPERRRRLDLSREGTGLLSTLLELTLSSPAVDLTRLPADNRLAWRPAKEKSAWICARQREKWEAWQAQSRTFRARGAEELRKAAQRKQKHQNADPPGGPGQREKSAQAGEEGHHDQAVVNGAPKPPAFDSGVAGLDELKLPGSFGQGRAELQVEPTF